MLTALRAEQSSMLQSCALGSKVVGLNTPEGEKKISNLFLKVGGCIPIIILIATLKWDPFIWEPPSELVTHTHLNLIIFDLFLIKIDHFWSIFKLKDRKRPFKCQLFNRKWWLYNIKRQIKSKTTMYIKNDDQNDKNTFIFDHFQSNSTNFRYKSNYFWYKWSWIELNRRDE